MNYWSWLLILLYLLFQLLSNFPIPTIIVLVILVTWFLVHHSREAEKAEKELQERLNKPYDPEPFRREQAEWKPKKPKSEPCSSRYASKASKRQTLSLKSRTQANGDQILTIITLIIGSE
jgi:hypothetical protein